MCCCYMVPKLVLLVMVCVSRMQIRLIKFTEFDWICCCVIRSMYTCTCIYYTCRTEFFVHPLYVVCSSSFTRKAVPKTVEKSSAKDEVMLTQTQISMQTHFYWLLLNEICNTFLVRANKAGALAYFHQNIYCSHRV